jgi:hypothetical protein
MTIQLSLFNADSRDLARSVEAARMKIPPTAQPK